MASTTKTAEPTGNALSCPECGKTFTRPAALGAHRKMTHGVDGTSANATGNRKKAVSRKPTGQPATSGRRRRTADAALTRPDSGIDRDALLRTLFPNGIPPRADVIAQANTWLDEAERLAGTS